MTVRTPFRRHVKGDSPSGGRPEAPTATHGAHPAFTRPQGAISPPEFADAPMAKLILYTNLEVIHHGAEICLLRDLYLWKDDRW